MRRLILIFVLFSQLMMSQSVKNVESIAEIKTAVKESIDAFAFDEDSNKRRYKVEYEDNNVRLLIMKRNGSAPINKGLVFDFSNVYRFDKISRRRNDINYINIWVSLQKNKKKNKWDKHKLIMRVYGYKNAVTILKALKKYNKALKLVREK